MIPSLTKHPSPLLRGCPGPRHLPEKERWTWGWKKGAACAPSHVLYLFLWLCSSFLSSLFHLLLSSCLLWFLHLHVMRFLGWFLRGGLPDGFFFPLPLLSLFPLLLVFLGGTSRLKKKSGHSLLETVWSFSVILTASSCILSSLSSSSWSLYFSLIFFNLFWRDEKKEDSRWDFLICF